MKKKQTYTFLKLAAILMSLALLWLTVSAPFVNSYQQQIAKQAKITNTCSTNTGNEEEPANPFGNTTEEKVPDSNSFSEEYLHDHGKTDRFTSEISQFRKCEKTDTYLAFHGEILVPPPNIA